MKTYLCRHCIDLLKHHKYLLEFHLSHRCNLNCYGCNRCASLFNKESDYSFHEFKEDFDKFLKYKDFSQLEEIHITGGEPLVNKDFFKIVEYIRKFFNKKIYLMTNGLKFLVYSDAEIEFFKRNNIQIVVTQYSKAKIDYNKIKRKIDFKTFSIVQRFCYKTYREVPEFKSIPSNCQCCLPIAYKGELVGCEAIYALKKLNEVFKINFEIENYFYNINDFSSFKDVTLYFLKNKVYPCEYCCLKSDYTCDWHTSSKIKDEWIQ